MPQTCPQCFTGVCRKHPRQDSGRSVRKMDPAKAKAILDSIYAKTVEKRLSSFAKAAVAAEREADRISMQAVSAPAGDASAYRMENAKAREKASRKRRRDVQVTQLTSAQPVSDGSSSSSDDSPSSDEASASESASSKRRKERRAKKKAKKAKKKEKKKAKKAKKKEKKRAKKERKRERGDSASDS